MSEEEVGQAFSDMVTEGFTQQEIEDLEVLAKRTVRIKDITITYKGCVSDED